jgi:hypothetical protein
VLVDGLQHARHAPHHRRSGGDRPPPPGPPEDANTPSRQPTGTRTGG